MTETRDFNGVKITLEAVNDETGFQRRLVAPHAKGNWCGIYEAFARLEYKGRTFISASQYWGGVLPVDVPLEVCEGRLSKSEAK